MKTYQVLENCLSFAELNVHGVLTIETVFFIYYFPLKGTRLLVEMEDSRDRAWKVEEDPETSWNVQAKSKDIGASLKGLFWHIMGHLEHHKGKQLYGEYKKIHEVHITLFKNHWSFSEHQLITLETAKEKE